MPVQLVQGSEQTLLTTSSRRQILGTMSWLLHPEPLGLTPFRPGRECQMASGKFLYQVWFHQFLGGVSLSRKPDKHRVKAGKTRLGSIPVSWAMATQIRPAKTGARLDPILGVINVEKACPASMGDDKNTARHRFS